MTATRLRQRIPDPAQYLQLQQQGHSELMARILAARLPVFAAHEKDAWLKQQAIITPSLAAIHSPALLQDAISAADRIVQAIQAKQIISILTDYDVDGITSHALIFRALTRYFGVAASNIQHHIGHRLEDGYGISQSLVDRILAQPVKPHLIISADCGSSDEARIARLQQAGIDLIVTDHHALPVEGPPQSAFAVVNPTREDCDYPDATIAGVMVAWLLMSQVRTQLIAAGILSAKSEKLVAELSFVALGTVADCVTTASAINRAVIQVGLKVMNKMEDPCWRVAKEQLQRSKDFTAEDLGFQIGPRINARSRLADPFAALHYLLAKTDQEAHRWLAYLNEDNEVRKLIEKAMVESAKVQAQRQVQEGRAVLVIYLEEGHSGVQGIVASRLISQFGRPVFVLCDHHESGLLSGSGRSIAGFHLRDALQAVEDQQPGLLVKFGGHQGAAGLTIAKQHFQFFASAMNGVGVSLLAMDELVPQIWTDGSLSAEQLHLDTCEHIQQLEPFGREFEKPLFSGEFPVMQCQAVGADPIHLKITLQHEGREVPAIWFRARESAEHDFPIAQGDTLFCAYSLERNEFRKSVQLQLQIHYGEKREASR